MLKVTLADGTVMNISFQHNHATSQVKGEKPKLFTHSQPSGRGSFNSAHFTQANIYTGSGDTKNVLSTGNAICSLKDNFNKREGKRLSLERAIENLALRETNPIILSVDDRKTIWTAFRVAFPDNALLKELGYKSLKEYYDAKAKEKKSAIEKVEAVIASTEPKTE